MCILVSDYRVSRVVLWILTVHITVLSEHVLIVVVYSVIGGLRYHLAMCCVRQCSTIPLLCIDDIRLDLAVFGLVESTCTTICVVTHLNLLLRGAWLGILGRTRKDPRGLHTCMRW